MTSATVVVTFTDPLAAAGAGIPITLEVHPGFTGVATTRLRMYPDVPAFLRTNFGTVVPESSVAETIVNEVIQFTGGNIASGSRPIIALLSVSPFGALFDVNGGTISPSFAVSGGSLQSSVEDTYGGVSISYRTTYKILRYEAEVTGFFIQRGTVLAFYQGQVAGLDIPLAPVDETNEIEIYSITSDMVVNSAGAFEMPDGWTGESGTPTWFDGTPDPDLESRVVRRVHEQGLITSTNAVSVDSFHIRLERPWVGSFNFTPTKTLRVVSVGENGLTQDQFNSNQAQSAIASAEDRADQ